MSHIAQGGDPEVIAANNAHRVHPLAPVFALDLDGTMADYFEHFRWFASMYKQQELSTNWGYTRQGDFDVALGLEKEEYRDIKLAYRQGGLKRSLPPIDLGVHDVVPALRKVGVQVWICTTRPWLRLDNVDPDTRFWIERMWGRVDGLLYGEDKYADLIDIVGKDRILGIADDLPENIERATELGLPSILRAGGHNKRWRDNSMGPSQPVATHSIDIFNQVIEWKVNQ